MAQTAAIYTFANARIAKAGLPVQDRIARLLVMVTSAIVANAGIG